MPSPATLQALETLKQLQAKPYKPQIDSTLSDPTVQRMQGFQQMEDELKDRLFSNQRAQAASTSPDQASQYGGEVTALKNMLGSTQQDIEESPLTAQRAQVENRTQRIRAA